MFWAPGVAQPKTTQPWTGDHSEVCEECDEGGRLLCCDYCNLTYHRACLPSAHQKRCDDDRWPCPRCRKESTLAPVHSCSRHPCSSCSHSSTYRVRCIPRSEPCHQRSTCRASHGMCRAPCRALRWRMARSATPRRGRWHTCGRNAGRGRCATTTPTPRCTPRGTLFSTSAGTHRQGSSAAVYMIYPQLYL